MVHLLPPQPPSRSPSQAEKLITCGLQWSHYAGKLIRLRAATENINLLNPLIIRLTPTRVPMAHSELPGHGYAINPPSINVRIASQKSSRNLADADAGGERLEHSHEAKHDHQHR